MRFIRIAAALCVVSWAVSPSLAAGRPLPLESDLSGELTSNDPQRPSGKYEDLYVLEGRRGQRIEIRLGSADFDPMLRVSGPQGFQAANDDESGESVASRLVLELPHDGTYQVAVTTFRPGELGGYELRTATPRRDEAAFIPDAAEPLAIGSSVTGRLALGDLALASGEYADRFRFEGRRGERIRIDLTAGKFDAYLILRRPDGSQDENDDRRGLDGASTDSRIDTVLAEDGQYDVVVTSYRPGEAGEYRLSLKPSPGLERQANVPGGPRVLALLVGVADYGGRTSNLSNTDEDARLLFGTLRAAGLLHPASRLLVNGEATTKQVSEAFASAAAAAGPDDLFLFFFSGHGDQIDVETSREELDGRSETIELFDAALTDAELAPLFASVQSRMAMAVIDACYAGGFRSLVDRPNVIGLFSSEEDLTSLVANRFKAGGFLSFFLRAGLTGDADADGDRIVTAGELATYVRRRFRREGDIPAMTREEARNFQNLVIERGGVHVDDVIVRLAGQGRGAPTQVSTRGRDAANANFALAKGLSPEARSKTD